MKDIFALVSALVFMGCSTSPLEMYDLRYSDSEIAKITSEHFEISEGTAKAALKPAFKKYGAPHAYIEGLMSSVDDPDSEHLYGSGHFRTKLALQEHTFWRVDGENLTGHLTPVKTAHLVYKTMRLDPLSNRLEFYETLTKRGQTFSVFERKIGNEIVITFHKSSDLPPTTLDSVTFFRD